MTTSRTSKAITPDPVSELLAHFCSEVGIGEVTAKTPMAKLFSDDGLSDLEWALITLSIEIDHKVALPERLSSDRKITVGEFAKKVAELKKLDDAHWTLKRLHMLANAFMDQMDESCSCEECTGEPEEKPAKKAAPKAVPKAAAKAKCGPKSKCGPAKK